MGLYGPLFAVIFDYVVPYTTGWKENEMTLSIQKFGPPHSDWAISLLKKNWGAVEVVSRGRTHDASALSGFVAIVDQEPKGLVTYRIADKACEIVTLNTQARNQGIGTALVDAVIHLAKSMDCIRIWVITTNDNLTALAFYQKRGFELTAMYRNAISQSRKIKPEIPIYGENGIPIRDELELEMIV